ncbi:beta-fructofuranosidase, insoluble isoenzyme CWINV1 [Cannabis sativa]|uniref:beta-fructofuranosidase, insoluble isoenzyme CWINV1 n=1 Tax=Cannabis sativa TaxID=3483 RepID=UPI0029C9E943|nr:beta-fructofuranosidase, insoluble isoenzyme CWINV1 [Cannabis sativa]XP_060962580.1 beta-fructofuranosidase, insoluble isoenzyme CWINV1 [Cannabis sativa]XP_060962581.1 beta-fructofuranosidase, insoluble isoenzyme CWINV1 [Cannabis sativa]
MYYNGIYHLFYQYNPYGPLWGNITWAHSVSYNLIDWIHLDIALSPTDPNLDIIGCWSGSTTLLPGNKPAILYTGGDSKNRQVQNLALPKNLSDPFLIEWIKSPLNPLLTPIDDIDPSSFRDPTTAWRGPDNIWRVTIGARINGFGVALLYKSSDFLKWTRFETPLYLSKKNSVMWECLDFFPIGIKGSDGDNHYLNQDQFKKKYVLKASFQFISREYYILGEYSPKTEEFKVESEFMDQNCDLRLDYGKFYASKSFYDSQKMRRVLWGWVNESYSETDASKWFGLQSFPRSILLSKSGRQLVQWPIEEIEKLRSDDEKVSLQNKELRSDSLFEISGVTASQADVEVSFEVTELEETELMDPSWVDPQLLCDEKNASVRGKIGAFGLLVLASNDLSEQTAIFFRIFKTNNNKSEKKKYVVLMCSDQSKSSLRNDLDKTTYGAFQDIDPLHEKITLRTLIDHSIVESFGGEGMSCITTRVYPILAINKGAHLYVFNNGTNSVKLSKLNAWSLRNARFFFMERRRTLVRPLFSSLYLRIYIVCCSIFLRHFVIFAYSSYD